MQAGHASITMLSMQALPRTFQSDSTHCFAVLFRVQLHLQLSHLCSMWRCWRELRFWFMCGRHLVSTNVYYCIVFSCVFVKCNSVHWYCYSTFHMSQALQEPISANVWQCSSVACPMQQQNAFVEWRNDYKLEDDTSCYLYKDLSPSTACS